MRTAAEDDEVADVLRRWGVVVDGPAMRTATGTLVPGLRDGAPVMLKVAHVDEERRGAALLAWWAGSGAVPVLERDGDALLMVRATGPRDLAAMASAGRDEEAVEVLVQAVHALHAHPVPPADRVPLVPLRRWFSDLVDRPQADPLLAAAAGTARGLLAATRAEDVVALHGDVHHGNVLDLGDRWGAIDPKGLLGHRGFDLANLFCNPTPSISAERLDARLVQVAALTGSPPAALAAWVVAWCGLSLAWRSGEPDDPHVAATRAVLRRLAPHPR